MKKYLIKIYLGLRRFKNEKLPKYFIGSPFMSSLYYLLFSDRFNREHHRVLNGRVKHLREMKSDQSNIYTLIRNTHRLEKGLLMRPMRDVFALDYLGETVGCFVKIWSFQKMQEDKQYKWFYDVLNHYFEATAAHPRILVQKERFDKKIAESQAKTDVSGEISKSIPYKRLHSSRPPIDFDNFYELTKYRRSVRWFLDKPVPRALVDKALLAGMQSPSACNRQPFEYHFFDDPALMKDVLKLPMGVKGYAQNIPMIGVVVGNLDAYFDERDRHIIYIDASLANMSFMLALETLGLSSCSINWPDIEGLEKKMDNVLKLKGYQRPLMLLAIGYPDMDGMVAFSEKRGLENFRKYNDAKSAIN